ncbi:hypothetical protein, partial [Mesorhizobium sp. WSM4989]|uniref:hypothetical protein n=1 Tax=Mesorhizobium sp. WSM4989 TaxID=3038541 RepID=UPI002416AC69
NLRLKAETKLLSRRANLNFDLSMEISNIEKLNFNNFGTWEKDVQVLLLERNCLNIVLGKEQDCDPSATLTK